MTRAERIINEISEVMTAAVDEKEARSMGEKLQRIFWGDGPDTEHDSDTLCAAANVLIEYGYGPPKPEKKKDG
jgi:hypothetical protein